MTLKPSHDENIKNAFFATRNDIVQSACRLRAAVLGANDGIVSTASWSSVAPRELWEPNADADTFRTRNPGRGPRTKELEYLNNDMTWREFADAAGATVLLRGLARGLSKKVPTKTMSKLQAKVVLTMADAGREARVQDALKVIRDVLAKNGPHMTDQVMAKDAKKAKVSKRLQKQGEVVIANRREMAPRVARSF